MEVVLEDFRQAIHANATITASGSSNIGSDFGNKEVTLFVNIKNAPTGTAPSITFTIQEVDPGDGTTSVGTSKTGTALTATGTQILTLPVTFGGSIIVSWVVTGTAPSFTGVYTTLINKGTAPVLYDQAGNGPVAVKAASTAAVAGDPALVVAISPNNTVSLGPVTVSQADVTATGALNALNASVSLALAGTAGAGMQLAAGTLIGTVVPEISFDGGTTWIASYFFDPITGVLASSVAFASSNAATTKANIVVGGDSHVRVRVSAFTSGTATCNLRATTTNNPSTAFRGTDGTVLRTILLDTSGRIVTAPAGTFATTSGFVFGDTTLTSTGNVPVRRTTLTEQTTNAQRSVVSASANDTSAGTGARQVKLTYYDSTGAGPSTETITLNGTTAVNTVSTTICYVEKVEVTSVGSTGSNVGVITLKAATAGGGATIVTLNATDNQTFLALHYVPTGKTCYITGLSAGSDSTAIGQGGLYSIRAQDLSSATAPNKQVSDFFRLYGQSSGVARLYSTPIQVTGPARIQVWVNPASSNTVVFTGAFDFYDQ